MKRRRRTLWLALAGIVLRALVPAGYMPAPVAQGVPFVLCPRAGPGLAALIAAVDAAVDRGGSHDRGHDHGNGADAADAWEFCPFGAVPGASIVPAESAPIGAWPEPIIPATAADRALQSLSTRPWRARAPPTGLSSDV